MKGFGAKPDKKVKPIKIDLMDIPNFKRKAFNYVKNANFSKAEQIYVQFLREGISDQEINARYNSGIIEEKGYSFDV